MAARLLAPFTIAGDGDDRSPPFIPSYTRTQVAELYHRLWGLYLRLARAAYILRLAQQLLGVAAATQ